MTNMNKKMRDYLYPLIVAKIYGEFCCECCADRWSLSTSGKDDILLIDHIDNNNANNQLHNLQLLCRSCNTIKNHPRTTEPTIRNAPPEFLAGKRNYKLANKYVTGRLFDPKEHGAIVEADLIWDIAEYVDCSDTRARAYINKMCSKKHGLMTAEERPDGKVYIVWKTDEELDEIIKDTPKEEIEPEFTKYFKSQHR